MNAVPASISHQRINLDGIDIFYRECGPSDAPVLLLPHGYPCSSFEFRNLMPLLGDRWRLVAPDFPASGFSGTPENFRLFVRGFCSFLERFLDRLGIDRFALYLHDFGHLDRPPARDASAGQLAALIVQERRHLRGCPWRQVRGTSQGPALPRDEALRTLRSSITREESSREFSNGIPRRAEARLLPELLRTPLGSDDRAKKGHPGASDPRLEGQLRVVSQVPGLAARASATGACGVGAERWLYAREVRAGVAARPVQGGSSSSRWWPLASRDASRGRGKPHARVLGTPSRRLTRVTVPTCGRTAALR